MKKVLITGGLGYLGSVIAPHLQEEGLDVTVWDVGFFKDSVLYPPKDVRTVFKDARDLKVTDLKGVDVVVHLAGISNDPFGNLSVSEIYDPTRRYALKIAKLAKAKGARFIFASSCMVYGEASEPMVNEDSKPNPLTGYSKNKFQIEKDLARISDKDFSPIALRLSTVFGASPRMRFDIVINMFAGMALTQGEILLNSDGLTWRPNIDIRDAARAVAAAVRLDYSEDKLAVVNVGSDENNIRIREAAKLVAREAGGVPVKFMAEKRGEELWRSRAVNDGVDRRSYRVSFAKIGKVLSGFECRYSIRQGVRDLIEVLKSLKLDEKRFKDPKFYRLQTIEGLFSRGAVGRDLRWREGKNHAV